MNTDFAPSGWGLFSHIQSPGQFLTESCESPGLALLSQIPLIVGRDGAKLRTLGSHVPSWLMVWFKCSSDRGSDASEFLGFAGNSREAIKCLVCKSASVQS